MQSVIARLASYGKQAKNKPACDLHKFYSNQSTQGGKKEILACEHIPYAGKPAPSPKEIKSLV